MNNIGAFIAQLRKEQNMTQKELADKLGVTDKAVSKWERGKGIPDIDSIERLSNVLGVSVSELFAAKREETSQNYGIPKNDNIAQRDASSKNDKVTQRDEIQNNDNIPQANEAVKNKHKVLRCAANIVFICVCGALIFTGCYMLLVQKIPLSFQVAGGADGPTAMFVQTKPSMKIAGILIGTGAGLIAVRIFFYIYIKSKIEKQRQSGKGK